MWTAILSGLKGLWQATPPTPRTRLTEAEALAIARDAAGGEPSAEGLARATILLENDRTVWLVSTATVGSGLDVTVDDGTGEVLAVRPWGLR